MPVMVMMPMRKEKTEREKCSRSDAGDGDDADVKEDDEEEEEVSGIGSVVLLGRTGHTTRLLLPPFGYQLVQLLATLSRAQGACGCDPVSSSLS